MSNKFIDPKNPNTVGKSAWNLGNHSSITYYFVAHIFKNI